MYNNNHYAMKQSFNIFFSFVLACLITACKKEKSPGKETVLSKIYQDNKLLYEFVYSSQKRMVRLNTYDELTGQFDYANAFEYDEAGTLVSEKSYGQSNKLSAQVMYTSDATKKILYHEYMDLSGSDSGHITVQVHYSYDASGRVSQQTWIDPVTKDTNSFRTLTYYRNGNLKNIDSYFYYLSPSLQYKLKYFPEGEPLPESIIRHRGYPVNFLLYDLVAGEKHSFNYNDDQVVGERKEIFSNRQYDDKGYLLRQTLTKKNITPAGADQVIEMRYEYLQL
jgi:hypothetical protein